MSASPSASAPAPPSPPAPAMTTPTHPHPQPAPPPVRAVLKASDMADDMQQEMVDLASAALERYNIEKDIAMHIKKEADRRFGTTWHCVVGKNFGSFVTHETRYFIYFYLGQIAILLWKSS